MSEYEVLYSIGYYGFKFHWLFLALFAASIGLIAIEFQIKVKKSRLGFASSFGGFFLIWSLLLAYTLFSQYFSIVISSLTKNYQIVEGETDKFDPMPYTGRKAESFEVNSVLFKYSDFDGSEGFNTSCSHGGPICGNGQKVRITYMDLNNRNVILKLEIQK